MNIIPLSFNLSNHMFNLGAHKNIVELFASLEETFPTIKGFYRIIILDNHNLPAVLYSRYSFQESRYVAMDVMNSSQIEERSSVNSGKIVYIGYNYQNAKNDDRCYFIPLAN